MNMTTWTTILTKWTQAMLAVAMVCGLGSSVALGASDIVNDPFTDGDVTDGADLLDVEWSGFRGPTVSVQNDNGAGQLNGGNAMLIDRSGGNVTGAAADIPGGQRQLVSVGDFIKMEFDFRILASQLGTPGFDSNVTNRGFRGGFFARNGTAGNIFDDKGYFFQTGVGAIDFVPSSNEFVVNQELGTDGNGPANGADKASGPSGNMLSVINNELPRSAAFTLTRTALGVEAAFDITGPDATGASVTSSTSAEFYSGAPGLGTQPAIDLSQFEYFGIFGSKKAWDLLVDNVRITTNAPVPEPSSLVLGALGLAAMGLRRRS